MGNQRGHGNDLYYCVYNSEIYITTTCSNAKDNIYFVIICNYLFTIVAYFLSI